MALPEDSDTHDWCQRTAACLIYLQTANRCRTKSALSAGGLHVHVLAVCGAVCTHVACGKIALSDGCAGDVWASAYRTCACVSGRLTPWRHCLFHSANKRLRMADTSCAHSSLKSATGLCTDKHDWHVVAVLQHACLNQESETRAVYQLAATAYILRI